MKRVFVVLACASILFAGCVMPSEIRARSAAAFDAAQCERFNSVKLGDSESAVMAKLGIVRWHNFGDLLADGTVCYYTGGSPAFIGYFDGFRGNLLRFTVDDNPKIVLRDEAQRIEAAVRAKRAETAKKNKEEAQRRKQAAIEEYLSRNPNLSQFIKDALRESNICTAMPAEAAEIAWGKPERKNISAGTFGRHEQWIYGRTYVYIQNGLVTSWSYTE